MSSLTSSPVSSRASSPQIPSRAESRTASARRSVVCWADLADSDEEDDGPISYAWSTISTATSSPAAHPAGDPHPLAGWDLADRDRKAEKTVEIVTVSETFKSPQVRSIAVEYQLASPQTLQASGGPCGQAHVYSKAAGHSAIRWVDLMESDVDPVDYAWSCDASVLEDASLAHEPCQGMPTEVSLAGVSPVAESMGSESGRSELSSDSLTFIEIMVRGDDLDSGHFHACVGSAAAKAGPMNIILGSSKESHSGTCGEFATVVSQGEPPTLLAQQRRHQMCKC